MSSVSGVCIDGVAGGARHTPPPPKKRAQWSFGRYCARSCMLDLCPSSGRGPLVCKSTDTVHLKGIGISVCCLKLNFTTNVSFRRAAASRGSGFTRIMASRAPKCRADDQHCLSSFFRAKVPDRNSETAAPFRFTTLVSTRRRWGTTPKQCNVEWLHKRLQQTGRQSFVDWEHDTRWWETGRYG